MKWGREDSYLFLMILKRNEATMEFKMGYTERLGRRQLREKMNSHKKFEGKLKKILKTAPIFAKHVFFATEVSRQVKPPKHSKTEFWKKFLSVFRDWKIYPWGSRELSRENLWVTLATGPSTREQVAKTDPRTRNWDSQFNLPATESPKQGKNGFFKFSNFENKILSKNT